MEIKLTDEQVEKAIDVWLETETYEDGVRAIAPFLQCPIAEPTEEEVAEFDRYFYGCGEHHLNAHRRALSLFISRRNAALTAKPDPRLEIVSSVIQRKGLQWNDSVSELSAEILAALDEVSK